MLDKVSILGVTIYNVTLLTAIERVLEMVNGPEKCMIFTPNTEIVMEAQKDQVLKEVLNKGDLVIPDGIGLVIASNIHKLGLTDRVPGVELMGEILRISQKGKYKVFLFGSKEEVVLAAKKNIESSFNEVNIVGYRNGYFKPEDESHIIDEINRHEPDFLFVALGAPKQEKWIYENLDRLKVKVAMGVGGSFDVYAGVAKRAPIIFQKLCLEWFYRLLKEPHRIVRMMSLPKFLVKSVISKDFYKL